MYRPAATVITTVVTPAASRDLTVSAVVADDWGVTDATVMGDGGFLDRTVTRCSRAAENFCNRIFAYETVQDDISLPHDGFPRTTSRRTFTLQLSRWPVAALTSVAVDGDDLVAGTDFLLDAETGQLTRRTGPGSRPSSSIRRATGPRRNRPSPATRRPASTTCPTTSSTRSAAWSTPATPSASAIR